MITRPLDIASSSLVVIDVQGKLAQLMHDKETLFKNIIILIKAAKALDIPIVWCQQVPHALGPTLPAIAELLTGLQPIDKAAFSCCGNDAFNDALNGIDRPQTLLCGIETHVCVYQTAMDLTRKGYEVTVVADAVSSRTAENKQVALFRMAAAGIAVASAEMVLFELLRTAEHGKFREIARLVK